MAQHASNVAGPSNSNAQVVIEPDVRMPSHLSDFVTKSVKEFKKLRQDHAKRENYLARLSLQYEEGTIPHSLRMKPPKLQIGDPEAQTRIYIYIYQALKYFASLVLCVFQDICATIV